MSVFPSLCWSSLLQHVNGHFRISHKWIRCYKIINDINTKTINYFYNFHYYYIFLSTFVQEKKFHAIKKLYSSFHITIAVGSAYFLIKSVAMSRNGYGRCTCWNFSSNKSCFLAKCRCKYFSSMKFQWQITQFPKIESFKAVTFITQLSWTCKCSFIFTIVHSTSCSSFVNSVMLTYLHLVQMYTLVSLGTLIEETK